MANSKISALPAYVAPLDADLLVIVDIANGITKKVTYAALRSTLGATFGFGGAFTYFV